MTGSGEHAGTVGLRPAATVLAGAGALWWALAAWAVTSGAAAPVAGVLTVAWVLTGVVVGGLVLLLAARRLSSAGAHEAMAAHRRLYAVVNTAQAAGIAAAVVVAGRAGAPEWIPVGVTAVFAVHFLPFAGAFRWRGYTWLGLALLLVAVAGAGLAATGTAVDGVHAAVGPAVAVVLWATVVVAVVQRSRGEVGDVTPAGVTA